MYFIASSFAWDWSRRRRTGDGRKDTFSELVTLLALYPGAGACRSPCEAPKPKRQGDTDVRDPRNRQAPLARPGAALRRLLHGHPRRGDRERRPPVDPGRPRLLAEEPAVGRERIRADVRRAAAARRPRGRPARAAAGLRRRRLRVRARLAARGPGPERRAVGRRARPAGDRSRRDDAGRALDP